MGQGPRTPATQKVRVFFVALLGLASLGHSSGREVVPLVEDWKFLKREIAPDQNAEEWQKVSVPHTWNAVDGANGREADPGLPEGYYRGPAWYECELPVPTARDRKTRKDTFYFYKANRKGGQSKIPDSFLNNNCCIALKSVRIFLGMHFIQSELFHLKKA
jgi:hypothetical protein